MYRKIAIPLWLITIFGPETYLLFASGYAGWKFAVAVGIYLVQVAAMAGCVWLLNRGVALDVRNSINNLPKFEAKQ